MDTLTLIILTLNSATSALNGISKKKKNLISNNNKYICKRGYLYKDNKEETRKD